MLAIGNEELVDKPDLKSTITCWRCGKKHKVSYGRSVSYVDGKKVLGEEDKTLGFMKCKGKLYLCGVGGKEFRPKLAALDEKGAK